MLPLILAAAVVCQFPQAEIDAAYKDRASFSQADQYYIRYISTSPATDEMREDVTLIMKSEIPSSSRAVLLDRQIPELVKKTETLYRIDLRDLQWDVADYATVTGRDPYGLYDNKLIVSAQSLIVRLNDTTQSDSHYLLLYGKKNVPKTQQDFEKFWHIELRGKQAEHQRFGWVETKHNVNVFGRRFVTHFDSEDGSYWRTDDVKRVINGQNPLDAPDGKFKKDGSEAIKQIPKVSIAKKSRGALQVYGLFNDKNERIENAANDLVKDSTEALGRADVCNKASCTSCHTLGMKLPNSNGVADKLAKGEELRADSRDKKEDLESFHLTDAIRQLKIDNENYALAMKACNGLDTETNAAKFLAVLKDFRQPLDLKRAAHETNSTEEELVNAIGLANAVKIDLGSDVAGLAHGDVCPREQFEGKFRQLLGVLKAHREAR